MRLWTMTPMAVLCLTIGTLGPARALANETENGRFPYQLKRLDLAVMPVAFGFGILGERLENRQTFMTPADVLALDRGSINSFDRSATRQWSTSWDKASDRLVQAHLYIPWLLIAGEVRERRWKNTGTFMVMYLQAYHLTKGLTKITKYSVGRKRPYFYNTGLPDEQRIELSQKRSAYGSFVSGHTSGSFCAAVMAAKVYQDTHPGSRANKWIWGVSLTAAAVSGYARYRAGQHYPSDVIGGAIVGSLVGYIVPTLHKNTSDTFHIGPAGPGGLSVTVSF